MTKKLLTVGLILALTLVVAGTALAAFSATGNVLSVGATSFEMDVAGTTYTVNPPEGFDLTTLMVGDTVEVVGEVDLNVVTATSVTIVTEEEVVVYTKPGYYCENPDVYHPALQKIADSYGVPYEEVLAMFCGTDDLNHNGVGGIRLAYKTAERLGDGTTAADVLAMKDELGGWGRVWQYYGLIGNNPHNTGTGDAETTGTQTGQGTTHPNNGHGNGNGGNGNGNGHGNGNGNGNGNGHGNGNNPNKPEHANNGKNNNN